MSMNAATLKLLADKGLTAQDIVEVAEALEVDAVRSPSAIRQARYRQRGGSKIPEDMRQDVFARDGYACLECGSEDYLQCDHVHPVSKGGGTNLDNLQTLCRVCNARKKDRIRKRNSSGTSNGNSAEAPVESPLKENSKPCSVSDETADKPLDPAKQLFDLGLEVLTSTGMREAQARSVVGKWRKAHGVGKTLEALLDCRAKAISNPVEWLTKRLGAAEPSVIDMAEASARRREHYERTQAGVQA